MADRKIGSVFSKPSSYRGMVGLSSLLRKGIMSTYRDFRKRFLQDFTTGWNLETLNFADLYFHGRLAPAL
jgi:hypothetical protein